MIGSGAQNVKPNCRSHLSVVECRNLEDASVSSKVLVLIPARYQSSRFPGKPLAKIGGKAMVRYVYDNMDRGGFNVCVITDDTRIETHLLEYGIKTHRVDDNVSTGTERVALAYQRFFKKSDADFIVNVQGDEPLVQSTDITRLTNFHAKNDFDITTLVRAEYNAEAFSDPNQVKAAFAERSNRCLYFSRSSIPSYYRGEPSRFFIHIGVYCFCPKSLAKMCAIPPSALEKAEGLEQLRALEEGMGIGALETTSAHIGIDQPEDIAKAERLLSGEE